MSIPAAAPVSGRSGLVDFVEEYAAAAEWFAVTTAQTDVDAVVPSCPGWTTYDLVVHLGNVHSWAATIVETGRATPDQNDEPSARSAQAAAQWYAGKAEDLYQVLRAADPEAPCWNFAFGAGEAGFWQRRQLHETLMHGVDLALAAGSTPQLRPDLAADGIDEMLTVFLHRMHTRGHPADLAAPLCLVATDAGKSWTLRPRVGEQVPAQKVTADPADRGVPRVSTGVQPAKGVDRITATADVLLRLLWKRVAPSYPTVHYRGNRARIDRFLASRITP